GAILKLRMLITRAPTLGVSDLVIPVLQSVFELLNDTGINGIRSSKRLLARITIGIRNLLVSRYWCYGAGHLPPSASLVA
ncbi:hypothetical protein HN51_044760, partial [Arachis hypogaea]